MFSFLTPFFLGFAAFAAVPLLLHMMQRHRIVRMPFSTIRFLKMAQKRSSNRIRMENFFLWLIRTLLMIVLAIGFAMPMIRTSTLGQFLGRSQRDIAIVIDASYSMGYQSGKETVWDKVISCAIGIVEGLENNDRVCIFVSNDDVKPVMALDGRKEYALSQLKTLAMGLTTSQLCPATLAALEELNAKAERHEREVHILTDGQSLPWRGFSQNDTNGLAAAKAGAATNAVAAGKEKAGDKDKKEEKVADSGPRSTRLDLWQPEKIDKKTAFFVTILGATTPENAYPIDIEIQPRLLLTETTAKVQVKAGFSGPSRSTTVSLFVDDKEIGSRAAVLGAAEADDMSFNIPPSPAGMHIGRVETTPDNLSVDDAFYFLFNVRESLPTLCVGDSDDCFFLLKALNASLSKDAAGAVRRIPVDELSKESLSTFSCVFLCNGLPLPSQGEVIQLEQYVENGGLLVIFPGDKGTIGDYQVLNCLPATPNNIVDIVSSLRKKMLRWDKPQHQVLRTLKLGPGGSPVVTISRALDLQKLNEGGETLILMGEKEPFLASRDFGRGRVLLFAVAADRTWGTFPLSAFYLPIVHQVVQYGGSIAAGAPYLYTTRNLSLEEHIPSVVQGMTLQDPTKNNVSIRSSMVDNKPVLRAEDLLTPGIYMMSKPDTPNLVPALALNLEAAESDLTPVKQEDIPKMLGVDALQIATSREDLEKLIRDYRVGRTLGETLIWIAFILAVIEVFYANFKCRKAPTLSDALAVEASGKVTGSGTTPEPAGNPEEPKSS